MAEYYIQWLISRGFDVNDLESKGFNGNTPLLQAALEGELIMVKRLLDAKVNLYAVNNDFNGVLFNACYANNKEIITNVVKEGGDINDVNEEGTTALMYAASAGKTLCVKTLLSLGSDVALENEDGYKAIDLAANKEVLKLLRYA